MKIRISKISLLWVSSYRKELMGIATVLILFCHAPANGVAVPYIIDKVLRWGGIGVDVFLLCSGVGMFFSLKKERSLMDWYWKRYLRILIPFLLFAIPYYLFRMVFDVENLLCFLSNITTISFWTRHEGAWFVSMLIPLYFLTPLIGNIIDGFNTRLIPTVLLCIFSIIGACLPTSSTIFHNIQMCLGHMPSFFVGYWSAKYVMEAKQIYLKWVMFAFIPYLLILPFYKCLHVSSNWMIVLPGSLLLVALVDYIQRLDFKQIGQFLAFLGTISLESYLANIYLPVVMKKVGIKDFLIVYDERNYIFYTIVICVGLLIANWGHQISNRCLNSIRK